MAAAHSLRARQIGMSSLIMLKICGLTVVLASVEKVLNLNQATTHHEDHDPSTSNGLIPQATPILNSDGEPIWKVLVFDNMGRDVISSVLRVNDLRSWGVTIHLYVEVMSHRNQKLRNKLLTSVEQEHQLNQTLNTRCACDLSGRTYPVQYRNHCF